jgi:hypothetical protein
MVSVFPGAHRLYVVAGPAAFLTRGCGSTGFSSLTLFTFIATFVQAWNGVAFYVFGGAGGLLAPAWFTMT